MIPLFGGWVARSVEILSGFWDSIDGFEEISLFSLPISRLIEQTTDHIRLAI